MKRVTAWIGAFLLAVSLAACGTPPASDPSSAPRPGTALGTGPGGPSTDTVETGPSGEESPSTGTGATDAIGAGSRSVTRRVSHTTARPGDNRPSSASTPRPGTATTAKAPDPGAAPRSISLSGMKTSFANGEAFSHRGLLVRVTYSDGTVKTAQGGSYTVDASAYRAGTAGEYVIRVKLKEGNLMKEYTVTVSGKTHWSDDGVLKILTIGNSFSDDSMAYVYQIAQACGIETIRLGNLYIGGCPLSTHVKNAKADSGVYEYRTNNSGSWSTTNNYKMSDAIRSENWDFISLQQASGSSGVADTYQDLPFLADYVRGIAREETALVWNMTWAYQQNSNHAEFPKYNRDQMTMYRAIVNAVKTRVLTDTRISLVIPTGTAVQNARTSYVGDTLTRDGYHLSLDFGRYVAGLTFVRKLCGVSIDDIRYAPAGVDDGLRRIAVEAANNAAATPFAVTSSTYTSEPSFDPSGYTKLDLGLTPFGFWNATDANRYNRVITDDGISSNYYATRRFTRAQLPVGSVILLESGWQYRPEGWKSDAVQPGSSRPGNTSAARIEVTADWWGDYQYRAFNIAKQGAPSLKGSEAAAAAALTIYVPKK